MNDEHTPLLANSAADRVSLDEPRPPVPPLDASATTQSIPNSQGASPRVSGNSLNPFAGESLGQLGTSSFYGESNGANANASEVLDAPNGAHVKDSSYRQATLDYPHRESTRNSPAPTTIPYSPHPTPFADSAYPTTIVGSSCPAIVPSLRNTPLEAPAAPSPPAYRVYKKRWFMLAVLASSSAINSLNWIGFAPVADRGLNFTNKNLRLLLDVNLLINVR